MTWTTYMPARGAALLRPAETHQLTRRELQVMDLIAEGCSNKEIAVRLGIAIHTVKTHVHNLLLKLGLRTRLEVAACVHAASREVHHRQQLQVA